MKTRGEAQAVMQKLHPRHKLFQDAEFQKWSAEMEEDLDKLQQISLEIPVGDKVVTRGPLWKILEMDPPKTHEEALRIYLGVRIAVKFWKSKLGQLKSESTTYINTAQKLEQSDGRANVGTGQRRTVGRIR